MNTRIMHVFHAQLGLGILETLFEFFTLNTLILILSHIKFKFSSISICIVVPELDNSQFITKGNVSDAERLIPDVCQNAG